MHSYLKWYLIAGFIVFLILELIAIFLCKSLKIKSKIFFKFLGGFNLTIFVLSGLAATLLCFYSGWNICASGSWFKGICFALIMPAFLFGALQFAYFFIQAPILYVLNKEETK